MYVLPATLGLVLEVDEAIDLRYCKPVRSDKSRQEIYTNLSRKRQKYPGLVSMSAAAPSRAEAHTSSFPRSQMQNARAYGRDGQPSGEVTCSPRYSPCYVKAVAAKVFRVLNTVFSNPQTRERSPRKRIIDVRLEVRRIDIPKHS